MTFRDRDIYDYDDSLIEDARVERIQKRLARQGLCQDCGRPLKECDCDPDRDYEEEG